MFLSCDHQKPNRLIDFTFSLDSSPTFGGGSETYAEKHFLQFPDDSGCADVCMAGFFSPEGSITVVTIFA